VRTRVVDRAALAAVSPTDLRIYVRATGWQRVGLLHDMEMWERPGGTEQASIPMRPDYRDYARAVYEVLRVLESTEQRSQEQILYDIACANVDVVRVRSYRLGDASPNIPINDGLLLIERARDMMLSAARSVVQARAWYASRPPKEASDFVRENVQLGQTEEGSYILRVLAPLPPVDQGVLLEGVDDPFARKATKVLARALAAVRDEATRAVQTGTVESFATRVPEGVSANLCDAIVGLTGDTYNRHVDVAISWSKARLAPADLPQKMTFTAELVPHIRQASEFLRSSQPAEDVRLTGYVVSLRRAPDDERGRITVWGRVGDALRSVQVQLEQADYHRAVGAHDGHLLVSLVGELAQRGRVYTLERPRDIQIVPVPESGI